MKWEKTLACFLILVSTSLIKSSFALDTLLPRQSIRDGESLVSANGTFELGFFSPGNSNNRYVGIWYHKIPEQTVVWIANRDWPLGDTSGELTFGDDGNLMVVDGRGAWFVFTYGFAPTSSTAATILDTGNLVLRDADAAANNISEMVLWQSFDYPTDQYLPGMLLGMVGKQNRLLSSWRSSNDPATGDFSFGADPNGTKQYFIWQKGHNMYWNTGLWNGSYFSNMPEFANVTNFSFVAIGSDYFLTLQPRAPGSNTRYWIDESGQFKIATWLDEQREWILYFSVPRPQCDVYNICGPFGVCNENQQPFCECLKGFQPGSLADWRNGATGGGCVRETILQCLSDGFLSVPHVLFPINFAMKPNTGGAAGCEAACLKNCTCTAYAFTDACRHWYGDLATLQQLGDDATNSKGGTLYVRLAPSELLQVGGKEKKLKITVSLTVVFVSFLFISIGSFLCWKRSKGIEKSSQEKSLQLLGVEIAGKFGKKDRRASEFTLFDFSCITEATNNFSNENKLGEGGFGPVYKGVLAQEQEIAVKRLSARSGQGLEEFKNEIQLIAKLQHRNLVRLLGCCIQREEKILIYEYMQNKSLDFFLFGEDVLIENIRCSPDQTRGAQLDWGRRFHIIEGIVQGLLYLHKHSRLRIIHRDLKASNVLLDAEMNPKISDFGMARIYNPNEIATNTIRVVGTYGYMSPEYVVEGLFSVKSDVFSFGVLLLEIVSGKRNNSFHQYKNSLNLVGYAWELWLEGKLLDLIDPLLGNRCPMPDISKCIQIGLLCVQESAADRPTMTNVITMLSSESATLPHPKKPGFFFMSIPSETTLPHKTSSLNGLTVTSISGR